MAIDILPALCLDKNPVAEVSLGKRRNDIGQWKIITSGWAIDLD